MRISDQQLEANRGKAEIDEAVRPYPHNTKRAGIAPRQRAKTDEGRKRSSMNALRHGIKNLALLQSLQAARQAQREAAMKEAAALLKLSEMKGLEYFHDKAAQAQVRCAANSKQNGFVFSNDQIHAAIDRDQRLRKFQTQASA